MSDADFDRWQSLAPIALLFLFIRRLQSFVRENLYVFLGAGAGLAFIDWMGVREAVLLVLGVLLIIVAATVIYFRRFRFRVEHDAIRVRTGVLEKKELRARFDRVQNIQLGQPLYFRPFGLVRFSLETPGASDKEVELPGIPRELAEWMRDRIATYRGASEEMSSAAGDEGQGDEVVFAAGPGRLFLHGLASNQIWLLVGGIAYLFSQFQRQFTDWVEDTALFRLVAERVEAGGMLTVALVMATVAGLFAVSGLIAMIRYHGFRLREAGDKMVAASGLLEAREQTVRLDKVTGLVFKQSAIGRLLGCWYAVVRQARSSDEDEIGGRGSFIIPGLRREDLPLAGRIIPGSRFPDAFMPVSHHFRRVFWLRWFLVSVAVVAAASVTWGWGHWSALLVVGLTLLLLGLLHLRFRHWGWSRNGALMWVREGLLGLRIDGFPLERVQQAAVVQSLYQRRHGLANLEVNLPQGTITVPFMPLDQAADLANLAIHAAETATVHRV